MKNHIAVICDQCRATGVAGQEAFADLGGLLDFDPVPRKNNRVDGWNAERQRAYVAALAVTGSPRRAAAAVGKSQNGIVQLSAAPGSEAFRAACDAAMAIAREKGSRRLAAGLDAVAGEDAARALVSPPQSKAQSRQAQAIEARSRGPFSPPPAGWLDEDGDDCDDDDHDDDDGDEEEDPTASVEGLGFILELLKRYVLKVEAERTARLDGRIVEADFYVRQLTSLEVMADLGSTDGFRALAAFREDGIGIIDIAETPMSAMLGSARRKRWALLGEPPRPDHPPRAYLEDHGRFMTEPTEVIRGGPPEAVAAQRRAFAERHARDAAAQLEWEARAREDHARRSGNEGGI